MMPPTFFSVDVETSAKTVTKGVLLTVGIVPIYFSRDIWALHPDRLYVRLEQGRTPLAANDVEYTSMPWWAEQAPEVRGEAYEDRTLVRHPLLTAARMIDEFVRAIEPEWGLRIFAANPVSFDKPWLDEVFATCNMPSPWHYRSLCLRSMKFGMDPSKGYGSDRTTRKSAVPHHALHDAEAQALDLVDMLTGAVS
jgi:hypothetical protein